MGSCKGADAERDRTAARVRQSASPEVPILREHRQSSGAQSANRSRCFSNISPSCAFLRDASTNVFRSMWTSKILFSAGVVGLMDAFAKFDPDKKVQFRSYAQFRIRGAILDSLRTLDWSPRELRRKGRAVEEAIRVLTARMGRAPGEGEVADELGVGSRGVSAACWAI